MPLTIVKDLRILDSSLANTDGSAPRIRIASSPSERVILARRHQRLVVFLPTEELHVLNVALAHTQRLTHYPTARPPARRASDLDSLLITIPDELLPAGAAHEHLLRNRSKKRPGIQDGRMHSGALCARTAVPSLPRGVLKIPDRAPTRERNVFLAAKTHSGSANSNFF